MDLTYHVTALQMPIYYNSVRLDTNATGKGFPGADIRGGDHDHDGLMYALTDNVPLLKYLRTLILGNVPTVQETEAARARAATLQMFFPEPDKPEKAKLPHLLVRPLVLRARHKDTVHIEFHNEVADRLVGMHLVGDGYDVKSSDGSYVGANPTTDSSGNPVNLAPTGQTIHYDWTCKNEGVFVFHDGGSYDGSEKGTNIHGLFGALAVEPPGAFWRDPVTERRGPDQVAELDGLYMDIFFHKDIDTPDPAEPALWENYDWAIQRQKEENIKFSEVAHREFVVVFHDEPEFEPPQFEPPYEDPAPDPCNGCLDDHGGGHGGGHGNGDHVIPIMPISYRAEPMINREHELFRLLCKDSNYFGDRPVLNEEQHHSSWMFGDPVTPILKAYMGDPVRIRLVHGGVKETHVFHLHLYEWHAAPQDNNSPRIDAISFSPQTGHTIEPIWGAGNRQQVAGDVIWHCHLYPHFHEGMWGMFRTFETLQDGTEGPTLTDPDPCYNGRKIGLYPDGTRIEKLAPLPGRPLLPRPSPQYPGYPLYIPGTNRQKSPIPPWPEQAGPLLPDHDYRDNPPILEKNAFNRDPVPGELFTRYPFEEQQARMDPKEVPYLSESDEPQVSHDIAVVTRPIGYHRSPGHEWWDPSGHLYLLQPPPPQAGDKNEPLTADNLCAKVPEKHEPLFFRANHGQILNLTLDNRLPKSFPETAYDAPLPPCEKRDWQGECALHVHMVKFDPICADGASVGWNYISGASLGKKMVHRWWLDQEFGTIFFHDHLFANYRQKRGLCGALIVEPSGARYFDNFTPDKPIIDGVQARIKLRPKIDNQARDLSTKGVTPYVQAPIETGQNLQDTADTWVREFCLALMDFIPMFDRAQAGQTACGDPLNPPDPPGGHGDQGVMAINYRCEPIRNRPQNSDPAYWFSSLVHGLPDTTGFAAHANDPILFRIIQGSHEEQHSFQIHGMRWRRFRLNLESSLRDQQTFGIAEAFTFLHNEPYGPGDYLYKLSSADDLWLGCWGLIRVFPRPGAVLGATPTPEIAAAEDAGNVPDISQPLPSNRESVRSESLTIPSPEPLPGVTVPAPLPVAPVRHFKVEAVQRELVYRDSKDKGDAAIVDPHGVIYRALSMTLSTHDGKVLKDQPCLPTGDEPLVLRCLQDEIVKVTLYNRTGGGMKHESKPPEVPVDRNGRPVSQQVSLHPDLLLYDVRTSDGASVGQNGYQTIPPNYKITYTWDTRIHVAPDQTEPQLKHQPLGPLMLQDMADFRHHRHHGLVGALIVEEPRTVPLAASLTEPTATGEEEAWCGARATLVNDGKRTEEFVLFMQDGLRLYENDADGLPLPDTKDPGDTKGDPEDQGQKAFNYRTEPRERFDTSTRPDLPPHEWLHDPNPATPTPVVYQNSCVRLHLIGACDKPRNHSFTVHGVGWPEHRFPRQGDGGSTSQNPCLDPKEDERFQVSSEAAITTGTVRTFRFSPAFTGDHAYRSGILRWDVPQGLWGILRVLPRLAEE